MSIQPPKDSSADNAIRISVADATSSHVDDLIRRQASLRGDTGIARDKGRKWYYQNWFVLMFAGLVGAIMGWALVEPLISDRPYVVSTLKAIKHDPTDPPVTTAHLILETGDYYTIKETRMRSAGGKWEKFDADALHPGDKLGVYVDLPDDEESRANLDEIPKGAGFIVINPPGGNVTADLHDALKSSHLGLILLFPAAAGLVGLVIGAADGIMCRLPRRVFIAGGVGLISGLVGGFLCIFLGGQIYLLIHKMAESHISAAGSLNTTGFLMQVGARGLGWALAGMGMGLGQGIALRSGKILLYGFLGGVLGGLFGGFLFDPIAFAFSNTPTALWSRMISLGVVGMSVGVMIGVVELLARDAWLRMVAGPLAGKEFLIFKNTMNVGASPRSDIYLFNDAAVAGTHAVLRANGDQYEIEATSDAYPLLINERVVKRTRLRHGDQIALGRTIFVFQRKRG